MIIIMKPDHSAEDLHRLIVRLEDLGLKTHLSRGEHRTLVGAIGDESILREMPLESLPGVEKAVTILKPYKLVSREFKGEDTVIDVQGQKIGGRTIQMIAGPCAVEGREVLEDQADGDGDGLGDACDTCPNGPLNDEDADGVCGDIDNCPAVANPAQADADADGVGDACDPGTDTDRDGFGNPEFPASSCPADNCPGTANVDQADADADGRGDVCDSCPAAANPGQEDGDASTGRATGATTVPLP